MSYSIPDCFMIAFICGFAFGLVYEAFRVVRLILRFKAAVFVCDVLFFVLAAGLVFKLSMVLGNYVFMAALMSFLSCGFHEVPFLSACHSLYFFPRSPPGIMTERLCSLHSSSLNFLIR